MDYIENRTFEEIQVGDLASLTRTLTGEDILLFAAVSGDVNPAHVDEEFARSEMFREVIAHGMWGAALISTVLGTELPGPGTIYVGQTLKFTRPVLIGDTITIKVRAKEKNEANRRITFDCVCTNQRDETVVLGTADVKAPAEKIKRPRVAVPEVHVFDREVRHRALLRRVEGVAAIRTAVIHPADRETLAAVYEALRRKIITPVLIGPEAKIRMAAEAAAFDLNGVEIVATEHSHAAVEQAMALARSGKVDVLMKGTLSTRELMRPILAKDSGLHTARRMSHVFVMDVPTYSRPLFLTDASLIAQPGLEEKRDIVQNAVDMLKDIGVNMPKVAILSAVEEISPVLLSTLDAAALCKMAERGQITGALLDGPLPFDAAVSVVAANKRGLRSPVAGEADVLVVPDLETGQMLVRQLQYLADTQVAGLVLGARLPIVVTGREETVRSRVAGCALAMLLVEARRRHAVSEPPKLRPVPLP